MDPFALVLRWVHIVAAAILVGGTIVMRLVILPSADGLDAPAREGFLSRARGRAKSLTHLSAGLLLVTGLVNYLRAMTAHAPAAYLRTIEMKMVLALVLLGLAIALTMPAPAGSFLVRRERGLLALNILLGIGVILLALVARSRG